MAELVRLFLSIMRYVLRVASHRMSEPQDLRDSPDQFSKEGSQRIDNVKDSFRSDRPSHRKKYTSSR